MEWKRKGRQAFHRKQVRGTESMECGSVIDADCDALACILASKKGCNCIQRGAGL